MYKDSMKILKMVQIVEKGETSLSEILRIMRTNGNVHIKPLIRMKIKGIISNIKLKQEIY